MERSDCGQGFQSVQSKAMPDGFGREGGARNKGDRILGCGEESETPKGRVVLGIRFCVSNYMYAILLVRSNSVYCIIVYEVKG